MNRSKIFIGEVSLFLLVFFVTIIFLSIAVFSTLEERREVFEGSYDDFEADYNLRSIKAGVMEELEPDPVDWVKLSLRSVGTDDWKKYQNNWYGFEIKYPQDWKYPVALKSTPGSTWQYRYQFRKNETDNNEDFVGLDVVVYDGLELETVYETQEFPLLKKRQSQKDASCEVAKEDLVDSNMYSMEKIQSLLSNECYEPSIFFSKNREEYLASDKDYIYNVIPVLDEERDGVENEVDPTKEIGESFPQFFVAALSFNVIDIKRPPPKPVITAPKPVSYKVDALGRLVCKKDNDKPSKSKKDKDHHLDMECCLDPDEDPNPWCYYDPVKYGEYL